MNSKQTKRIAIIDFLANRNIFPVKIEKLYYWYISPIRKSEETASFKVTISLNLWYDHGLGDGGDLVKLICKMFNCNVSQALSIIAKDDYSKGPVLTTTPKANQTSSNNNIVVTSTNEITDSNLIKYIQSRKVYLSDVRRFAKEVEYKSGNFNFTFKGIGLPNIAGGWEINNANGVKNSTSPKTLSWLRLAKEEIAIYEGMFSFFSIWKHDPTLANDCDFMILNSVSNKEKAAQLLAESNYKHIHLFLDNDDAGNSAVNCFAGLGRTMGIKLTNHSHTYSESNDLNDHIRGIKRTTTTHKDIPKIIIPEIKPPSNNKPRGLGM